MYLISNFRPVSVSNCFSKVYKNAQFVCINSTLSKFNKFTSGKPQGSIVGPILFNCFFNDFYYFIETPKVHNFS